MAGLLDDYDPNATPPAAPKSGGLLDDYSPDREPPAVIGPADIPANAGQGDWEALGKLGYRTGARVVGGLMDTGPTLGWLAGTGIRHAINAARPGTYPPEGDPKAPPSFSQYLLDEAPKLPAKVGLPAFNSDMDPNAGPLMKGTDFIAPWLVPGPGEVRAIGEAPSLLSQGSAIARYALGRTADAGLATGAQEMAKEAGYGDAGQAAAAVFGGGFRPLAQRGAGLAARAALGAPNGGEIFDSMTRDGGPGTLPSFGQVSNASGKGVEKMVKSVPFVGMPVDMARQRVNTAIHSSVDRNTGALGGSGDGLTQQSVIGQGIQDAAQAQHRSLTATNQGRQDALERAIGPRTDVESSPVIDAVRQLTVDPTTGPDAVRSLSPRIGDLEGLEDRQNPGMRAATQAAIAQNQAATAANQAALAGHQQATAQQQALHQAAVAAATTTPVTLSGKQATAHLENLLTQGLISPADLVARNKLLLQNKGRLTVSPNDPLYSTVAPPAPKPPKPLPPPVLQTQVPVPALPDTAAYGGMKDFRTELGVRSSTMDPVPGRYAGQVRDAATGVMRDAAVQAGQGGEFDAANQAYAHMMNTQLPAIEPFSGQPRSVGTGQVVFEGGHDPGRIAGDVKKGITSNPEIIDTLHTHVGQAPTMSAVGDTIANMGYPPQGGGLNQLSNEFRPARFATGFERINPETQALLDQANPQAAQGLRDAAVGGRAMADNPGENGITSSVGKVLAGSKLMGALSSVLGAGGAIATGNQIASAMESAPMVRMMAGRSQLTPLVSRLMLNLGLSGDNPGYNPQGQ